MIGGTFVVSDLGDAGPARVRCPVAFEVWHPAARALVVPASRREVVPAGARVAWRGGWVR